MVVKKTDTPWEKNVGDVPMHLNYFDGSMYDAVMRVAERRPNGVALDFLGRSVTYKEMVCSIDLCAAAFKAIGIKRGDRVTVALPNCPQAIFVFYAINLIGATANMIHPLSAQKESEFYLEKSKSVALITIDQFFDKFRKAAANTNVKSLIITSVADEMSLFMRTFYYMSQGRKIKRVGKENGVILWRDFIRRGKNYTGDVGCLRDNRCESVILYSGGTTGTTKGVVLTDYNFNALAAQVIATNPMFREGDKMLAAMPLFHGFGLGVCIHTMLSSGGRCLLVPRFTAKSYADQIVKQRCNFIAGVPTLFEALTRVENLKNADLSCLKGAFSGGDSLSFELKKKFDAFLREHNCDIEIREGYGTTETVTACCLTPYNMHRDNSIGLPFPDTYIKIVKPDSDESVDFGVEGEIVISGPTVMNGYLDNDEETAKTLRTHDDGLTWVYTGDLGYMDEGGFIYFKGRSKRMIVSSGYNVYPAQIENILDAHPLVQMSCVIGVPDPLKMKKIKAFVMLANGTEASHAVKEELMEYCRNNIAKYAMPYDIEFRSEFPKTLVGKVAYRILEEQETKIQ